MKYMWYFYNNLYTKGECEQIFKTAEELSSKQYMDRPADNKKVKTSVIEISKMKPQLEKFINLVNDTNDEIFGFKFHSTHPRTVNLNVYSNDLNEYDYHRDASDFGNANDIKLTAVLNISNKPFTGGEFTIFDCTEKRIVEIDNPGTLLIFPSFLYHKVAPVTRGERITLSCWFTGPNWR